MYVIKVFPQNSPSQLMVQKIWYSKITYNRIPRNLNIFPFNISPIHKWQGKSYHSEVNDVSVIIN